MNIGLSEIRMGRLSELQRLRGPHSLLPPPDRPGIRPFQRDSAAVLLPVLFLSSSFFHLTQLYRDSFYPFRYPRSSVRVMLELCGNCPICRCVFDTFVAEMNSMSSYSSTLLTLSNTF